MKTNNLTNNNLMFLPEIDLEDDSAIYFQISSEEFQKENSVILEEIQLNKPLDEFFWEENDAFDY